MAAKKAAPKAVPKRKRVTPIRPKRDKISTPMHVIIHPDHPPVDEGEVERLLVLSRQMHQRAQSQKGGRPPAWRMMMKEAFELRKRAIALDEQRTAPVWRDEQRLTPSGRDTHDVLMVFYGSQVL